MADNGPMCPGYPGTVTLSAPALVSLVSISLGILFSLILSFSVEIILKK